MVEQVRRNSTRFPADFMFELNENEYASLRSQIVTLKKGRGTHRKYLPNVFTEQGVCSLPLSPGRLREYQGNESKAFRADNIGSNLINVIEHPAFGTSQYIVAISAGFFMMTSNIGHVIYIIGHVPSM
jgi:hypothetical protein